MLLIVGGVALDWHSLIRVPREGHAGKSQLPATSVPPPPPPKPPEQSAKSIDPKIPVSTIQHGQQTPGGPASEPDKSFIGNQFPMSDSVDAACKSLSHPVLCDRLRHDLSEMAHQPRDPAWASDTEAKLQSLVESQKPHAYSVRNVECRETLCALEVVSDGPIGFPMLPTVGDTSTGLPHWSGNFAVGSEVGPSGDELRVHLFTYRRIQ